MGRARALVIAVGLGLLGGALVGAPASAEEQSRAESTLTWGACSVQSLVDAGFECATLVVPMDRNDPNGETVSLALTRHRSTGTTDERIGSLIFNPGGPGGSGMHAAAAIFAELPAEILRRFDLVSWDPRGVAESAPALANCPSPWPSRPATGEVDWDKVIRDFRQRVRRVSAKCYSSNPGIIDHMGTNEVVADLEAIRAALGEEQITYWGMSYGTRIGYVYALRYPERVRAILLDGPIDPAGSILGFGEGGVGPDQAYSVFAEAYPREAVKSAQVMTWLDKQTLPLPEVSPYTRWNYLDTLMMFVANQRAYAPLAGFVTRVHTAIFGTGEERDTARAALAKAPRKLPNSSTGGVFAAVNCTDYPDRPTVPEMAGAVRSAVRYAPMYGGSLATMYVTNCVGLPIKADPIPLITGRGPDVPVLISGSTMDGSTVSIWLARMSRAFPASRTVTYSGGQHVNYASAGSACVNEVVNRYFLELVLPPMAVGCSNTVTPESQ